MKLNALLIVNTVLAGLFGLGFVLMPATLLSYYDVTMNEAGLFNSRLLGTAFLSFAIISWLVRNSSGSSELNAIVLAFAVGDLIGFVISLIFQLQNVANALGWSTVAIYLLVGLGFGYFVWKKPGA